MYRTIHRIEQIIAGAREILEPNSVVDDISNATELLAAGAIVVFEPAEVTITQKPRIKKSRADASDSEFG